MSRSIGPPGSKCFSCGSSTAKRRGGRRPKPQLFSYVLTGEYMAANPQVLDYARHLGTGDQIESTTRICRKCVQRAGRWYQKREENQLTVEAEAIEIKVHPFPEDFDGPDNDPLTMTDDEEEEEKKFTIQAPVEVPMPSPDVPKEVKIKTEVPMQAPEEKCDLKEVPQEKPKPPVHLIPVPGYSRVSSASTLCVIAGCKEMANLHRIKVAVRAMILRENNIYIPSQCRVCNDHLSANEIWQDFSNNTRPRHELFNPVQLADMLGLLKRPYKITKENDKKNKSLAIENKE